MNKFSIRAIFKWILLSYIFTLDSLLSLSGATLERHLYPIPIKNRYHFIDEKGVTVLSEDQKINATFSNGLCRQENAEGKTIYIDDKGRMVGTKAWESGWDFREGVARVKELAAYGFIDKNGKTIIEPRYIDARDFSEGLAAFLINVQVEGPRGKETLPRWGYVDKQGRIVIKPTYGNAMPFSEGLAAVFDSELMQWGFIDARGKVVIKPDFVDVGNFSEGLARAWIRLSEVKQATQPRQFGLRYRHFNTNGLVDWAELEADADPVYVAYCYDERGRVRNGTFVSAKDEGFTRWGYINKQGRWSVRPQFEEASNFSDGLAHVRTVAPRGEKGLSAYIDKNGLAVIRLKYGHPIHPYHDFSKKLAPFYDNGKWGYMDTKGVAKIAAIYSSVRAFDGPLAHVELAFGELSKKYHPPFAYIDVAGKVVWKMPDFGADEQEAAARATDESAAPPKPAKAEMPLEPLDPVLYEYVNHQIHQGSKPSGGEFLFVRGNTLQPPAEFCFEFDFGKEKFSRNNIEISVRNQDGSWKNEDAKFAIFFQRELRLLPDQHIELHRGQPNFRLHYTLPEFEIDETAYLSFHIVDESLRDAPLISDLTWPNERGRAFVFPLDEDEDLFLTGPNLGRLSQIGVIHQDGPGQVVFALDTPGIADPKMRRLRIRFKKSGPARLIFNGIVQAHYPIFIAPTGDTDLVSGVRQCIPDTDRDGEVRPLDMDQDGDLWSDVKLFDRIYYYVHRFRLYPGGAEISPRPGFEELMKAIRKGRAANPVIP